MAIGTETLMARPKKAAAKGKVESGTKPVTFRATPEYADWLIRAAKADRASVATFLDRAATDRAKAIGFDEPAPERVP
jgi:uncharacterized protein (DUF1778 family)